MQEGLMTKWKGYGWIEKANHEVWKPFDREAPTEWILIGFGIGVIIMMILVGVFEWISQ